MIESTNPVAGHPERVGIWSSVRSLTSGVDAMIPTIATQEPE